MWAHVWAHVWALACLLALSTGACRREEPEPEPPRRRLTAERAEKRAPVDPSRVLAPPEGRFKIVFPEGIEAPKELVTTIASAVGPLVLHGYQVLREDEEISFMWSDYPKGHSATLGPKQVLVGVQSGAIAGMKATLDRDEGGERDGRPFRSFTFDAPATGTWKQGYGRQLAVLDGDRLYQVIYIGRDRADATSRRIDGYFASFEVTK